MKMLLRACLSTLTCTLAFTSSGWADDPGVEFFEKKVRPVLVEHCYSCHSKDAKKQRGGLLLDTKAGLRKGGVSGPALVPGKPKESIFNPPPCACAT